MTGGDAAAIAAAVPARGLGGGVDRTALEPNAAHVVAAHRARGDERLGVARRGLDEQEALVARDDPNSGGRQRHIARCAGRHDIDGGRRVTGLDGGLAGAGRPARRGGEREQQEAEHRDRGRGAASGPGEGPVLRHHFPCLSADLSSELTFQRLTDRAFCWTHGRDPEGLVARR